MRREQTEKKNVKIMKIEEMKGEKRENKRECEEKII